MTKVVLVNPANATVGYSVITPRWLFVIAGATPTEFAGDPVIVDVPVTAFNPEDVGPGDIVGVGIHTGNCRPGYRVVRAAKERGATVIVGGGDSVAAVTQAGVADRMGHRDLRRGDRLPPDGRRRDARTIDPVLRRARPGDAPRHRLPAADVSVRGLLWRRSQRRRPLR